MPPRRFSRYTFSAAVMDDDERLHLTDLLFGRDPVLRSNKRLFYMYWHCDIGATEDDASTD